MSLHECMLEYFEHGYTYYEILEFLDKQHGYVISLSTLKRHLRKWGMVKRPTANVRCSDVDLYEAVKIELRGSGSFVGYRRIYRSLLRKGFICRRDDVRKHINEIDPEGADSRKKRRLVRRRYVTEGPNYVWHIDGHDKLKPFGFSIHGCIDGFSRRIMWLEVCNSNKDPEMIAKFYLDTVKEFGLPLQVKADDGTEQALVHPIHVYLRSLDGSHPNLNPFSITSSPLNQRIEAFWSILQRDRIGWWRQLFQDLVDLNLFTNEDPVFVDNIRFCYMDILRKELNSVTTDWNSHLISPSRYDNPRGRPDTMYYLPHLYHKEDFSIHVDEEEIDSFYPAVTGIATDVSEEFNEFAISVIESIDDLIYPPTNVQEATELYLHLRQKIISLS